MSASLVHFDQKQNVQTFTHKTPIVCVCASTANVVVADQIVGATMDGITFEDQDRFLLKDQTNATENGVYQIVTGNPPVRQTDADTAEKVTNALVYVGWGGYHHGNAGGFRLSTLQITNVPSASQNKAYYQDNIISNLLADDQAWKLLGTDTITPFPFTVPGGVTQIQVEMCGGGGGGGGGAGTLNNNLQGSAGGGGGAGSGKYFFTLNTTPGDVLSIELGNPGRAGKAGFLEASIGGDGERPGATGGTGGITNITGVDFSVDVPGAEGGTGGTSIGGGVGGTGGSTLSPVYQQFFPNTAGDGGKGQFTLNHATGLGKAAEEVFYIRSGTLAAVGGLTGTTASSGGKGGGGGGGAAGALGIGGDGGQGGTRVTNSPFRVSDTYTIGTTGFPGDDAPNAGAGGGGGGGAKPGNTSGFPGGAGGPGGFGGTGYVRFSW